MFSDPHATQRMKTNKTGGLEKRGPWLVSSPGRHGTFMDCLEVQDVVAPALVPACVQPAVLLLVSDKVSL